MPLACFDSNSNVSTHWEHTRRSAPLVCGSMPVSGVRDVIHSYDMTAIIVHDLNYLKGVRWQYHDCLMLGDKGYLSAEVQKNLFDVANISLEVPYRLNQKNWPRPRKPIESSASESRPYSPNLTTTS